MVLHERTEQYSISSETDTQAGQKPDIMALCVGKIAYDTLKELVPTSELNARYEVYCRAHKNGFSFDIGLDKALEGMPSEVALRAHEAFREKFEEALRKLINLASVAMSDSDVSLKRFD